MSVNRVNEMGLLMFEATKYATSIAQVRLTAQLKMCRDLYRRSNPGGPKLFVFDSRANVRTKGFPQRLPSGFISVWPTDEAVLLPKEQPKVVLELLSDSDVNAAHEMTKATFHALQEHMVEGGNLEKVYVINPFTSRWGVVQRDTTFEGFVWKTDSCLKPEEEPWIRIHVPSVCSQQEEEEYDTVTFPSWYAENE